MNEPRCPFCLNDDRKLIETVAVVRNRHREIVAAQYLCTVCARQFSVTP